MDANTEKKLTLVHPKLAEKVKQVIDSLGKQGIEMRVVQGLRTYEEQNALYSQGRTRQGPKVTNAKGGQSYHNFGLACDLCPFKNGQPQWNDAGAFTKLGAAAKLAGLSWGGDWKKFPDRPHVQLSPIPDLPTCRSLYAKGGVTKVWEAVK